MERKRKKKGCVLGEEGGSKSFPKTKNSRYLEKI